MYKKKIRLTHAAVEAARVPHGGLHIVVMMIMGGRGQMTVGQGHHRVLLVSGRRYRGAELRAHWYVFDHLLGFPVRRLDEVRHSGSQSAVVRIVWNTRKTKI